MGWASGYIERLLRGETVKCRPRGHSMTPRIHSRQEYTIVPIKPGDKLYVDDVVLCRVKGKEYLHLIKAIQEDRYQIGNNHGLINGWIGPASIFGKLEKVEH